MQNPDFTARARQYWQTFLLAGPVGIGYALRLARVQRRLHRTMSHIEREKEVHNQNLVYLRLQLNDLVGEQQALNVAAAQFRLYCDKQAGARP
jgi:hypothetical protein